MSNRFHVSSRFALRLAVVISVGIIGTILLRASHALDTSGSDYHTAVQQADSLPTGGTTSCCSLSVNKRTVTLGATQHLTLNVTVRNTSQQIVQISPGLQMYVVDANVVAHPYTAAYLSPGAAVGGPLEPGASRSEDYDFDLDLQSAPKIFVFQTDASTVRNPRVV